MARKGKIKKRDTTPRPKRLRRDSPIERMKHGRAAINVYELTAADELLAAFAMMTGTPVVRDPDLGIPVAEPRPDAADALAARRSDLVRVYQQWQSDLHGSVALFMTRSILFVEKSPRSLDAEMRWRKGTARKHLLTGLRHFAALRGNTPRGARDWKAKVPVNIHLS